MGENSAIEWTDHTFNPWIGCTKVSPGCDRCYAETLATNRLGVAWGPHADRRRTAESTWRQPLAWNRKAQREGRPARVFCASLADVFDNNAPSGAREALWDLIDATPYLDWLLLTKRPQNIARMLPHNYMPPNIWLGTTVETQQEAERRIPHLLEVPAKVRFLSCEPLLGPVDLERIEVPRVYGSALMGSLTGIRRDHHGRTLDVGHPRIHWVIAGGESGPGARPSHPDWFRSLRDQCSAAGVPFFFKQWGDWAVFYDRDADDPDWRRCPKCDAPEERYLNLAGGHGFHGDRVVAVRRVGKKAAGATLDGREWREVPAAVTSSGGWGPLAPAPALASAGTSAPE